MKKSNLKIGDKIIQTVNGAGSNRPLTITDLDRTEEHIIVGMGMYGCCYDGIEKNHMFVKEDGKYEELTDEYVIVYKTGDFFRETYIDGRNKDEAIRKFKEEVGNYKIHSCELSND